jgi:hypothetical protein
MSEQHGQSTVDKIAESVRKAVTDGIEAVRPTWEEKVAPHVASGAAKAAEWGDSTRQHADKKAAELNSEERPSSKILGGALSVGGALVALVTGATRWVGKVSAKSAKHGQEAHAAGDAAPTAESTSESNGQS